MSDDNNIFYVVLFGKYDFRVYMTALQYVPRWSINRSYEKAYKFISPHYATMAIKVYCNTYGAKPEQFRILKVIEEEYDGKI